MDLDALGLRFKAAGMSGLLTARRLDAPRASSEHLPHVFHDGARVGESAIRIVTSGCSQDPLKCHLGAWRLRLDVANSCLYLLDGV